MYYRKPDCYDPIGVWVFKKILIPVAIIALAYVSIDYGTKTRKGKKLSKKWGYAHCLYIPADRFGDGEGYFLTGKINSDGTIDESAKRKIPIDSHLITEL
jgi:hypothetical protein